MVNPVSTSNAYSAILQDLLGAQDRQITAQQQVSTGKKGDDLAGFGDQTRSVVATNTVKARVDGLVDQLNGLQVKLSFQQSALGQVSDVAANLKQTLTDALANGSGDGIMTSLQSYFSQASQALNAQYDGAYLFSGGQTQTAPFACADLTALNAATGVTSLFKNGGLTPTSRVDDKTTIQTGFLAANIGAPLMAMIQAVKQFDGSTGNAFGGPLTPAQETFLQSAITTLDGVADTTTQTTAQGGGVQKQVDDAVTAQTARQTTLTNVLGDMTDVNVAQAASALVQAQNAVQASAQVFLSLKGMSLLNYLSNG